MRDPVLHVVFCRTGVRAHINTLREVKFVNEEERIPLIEWTSPTSGECFIDLDGPMGWGEHVTNHRLKTTGVGPPNDDLINDALQNAEGLTEEQEKLLRSHLSK